MEPIMCHQIRTCVLVLLGIAGWLALTPSTAESHGGRVIAHAAANQYLGRGYGYGGGYGYPRYYGGYSTAYGGYSTAYGGYSTAYGGGSYGLGNSLYYYGGGYPLYGYNNLGGYGYNGGYPAYGYGGAFGNAMLYGRGGGY
jgi:hypothetical protein